MIKLEYGVIGHTKVAYVNVVDDDVMRKGMWAFIREMRGKGYRLDHIVYCWGRPIHLTTLAGIKSDNWKGPIVDIPLTIVKIREANKLSLGSRGLDKGGKRDA